MCYKCLGLGHIAQNCIAEVKCTICDNSGHNFRNCSISFANKLILTSSWVHGGASAVESVVANPSPEDVVRMDDVVPTDHSEAPTDSEMDLTVIPDTQDSKDMDSDRETQETQDDIFEGDKISEVLQLMPTDCMGGRRSPNPVPCNDETTVIPGSHEKHLKGNKDKQKDKEGPTKSAHKEDEDAQASIINQDPVEIRSQPVVAEHPREVVTRAKRKAASQPAPVKKLDRSRSRIRFLPEDPKDTMKMTQIFLEDDPWHSCSSKSCRETFTTFKDLLDHLAARHPTVKSPKYPCAGKSCKAVLPTQREWIQHLANKHAEFVREKEIVFFDKYFLKQ